VNEAQIGIPKVADDLPGKKKVQKRGGGKRRERSKSRRRVANKSLSERGPKCPGLGKKEGEWDKSWGDHRKRGGGREAKNRCERRHVKVKQRRGKEKGRKAKRSKGGEGDT